MATLNLLELHAREKMQMPETWIVVRYQCLPFRAPTQVYKLEGACCPPETEAALPGMEPKTFTIAQRWKRRDRATQCTAYLSVIEHEAWTRGWERRTGLCAHCVGTGQDWCGWDHQTGNKYRPCMRCRATGKADVRWLVVTRNKT